jgi:signal transduction histidine kinase
VSASPSAGGLRSFFFSFQTKLVLVITAVIVIAILLAGAVFVVRERNAREEAALEEVASSSPAIYQQVMYQLYYAEDPNAPIATALDDVAADQRVRILLLGPDSGVLHDTSDRLTGQKLEVPISDFHDLSRGFVAWQPPGDFPEEDLTFVSASSRTARGPGPPPFRIVLAVETDTIAGAWREVVPGLLLAALVAIPFAAGAGMVLARQVAQPVRKLTAASEAMAHGDFDQRVEVDRDDEIGRLARSFTSMAERVGDRDTQMRTLIANVSHDLKTPMTSITGYAKALTDGTADPEDVARIGAVIGEEAEHVNRLIDDLLYLGALDADESVQRRQDVALHELAARCVRRMEPLTSERGIAVTLDVPEGLVVRNADGEKLERALTNIVENAVKFTPDGGDIAIAGDDASSTAVLSVQNTGAPIPDEDLPRLFDRFFRGDRARRTSEGNGLGLAITSEIVALHGGSVTAANVPGGVRFTIALPA